MDWDDDSEEITALTDTRAEAARNGMLELVDEGK